MSIRTEGGRRLSSTSQETSSGVVVVDKPAGLTSHDVVNRVRRLAGTRKVGHAGTLDPMATGVLVLGVNRATRLLGHLASRDKSYDATIRLGISTVTDDAEGQVVERRSAAAIDPAQVPDALAEFVGDIDQVPTAVSAIKVAGRRAYDRVRAGESVTLTPRPVTIHRLEVGGMRSGSAHDNEFLDVDIQVRCSSGTYVRAIARDLGATLGVGGHLTALRRTAVGAFGLDRAATLEDLADRFALIDIAEAARTAFPVRIIDRAGEADARTGRPLDAALPELTAVLTEGGEFLALYRSATPGASARPVAVFVG
ncbi:MAG: tRNA pseudouridine(55) synthase TruB [Nocardioides sp.]